MWMPQSGRAFPRWPREAYAGSSFDENLDRFIPNRSAMDFDFAKSVLTQRRMKAKENTDVVSPTRQAYRKKLAEACDMNRRIFAFKNKTPIRMNRFPQDLLSSPPMPKPLRHVPRKPERSFVTAEMLDDFSLNLLDWGSNNVLAFAFGNTAYLWDDVSEEFVVQLVTLDYEDGPITSIKWAPDSCQIAIGLANSYVQLWDCTTIRKIGTFKRGHREGVGSLAWNNHILTSGGMDGKIINRDVRMKSPIVETYVGHREAVCGLKWSESHRQLASGGEDNVVYIWDRSLASSSGGRRWLHKFVEHTGAVRALAWCPFESSLLASGGGGGDQCIKVWNTHSGNCLSSTDSGSEVCSLLWNVNERELLSSHGFSRHQLTLWKYPSMEKMVELSGHRSRVLYMAQSPDGCTVASAAGHDSLKFWNVFGAPSKPEAKAYREPFAQVSRIR